jgi:tRNA nucleotidyltransferase (CCA-adding enzyme)
LKTLEALQELDRSSAAEVFLVGGYVRDLLIGRENNDLDIVVRGLPLKKVKSFLGEFGKLKNVRLSKTNDIFDVHLLLFKGEDRVEAQISLPRKGKNQRAHFRNTLGQDARFRDFTVNCMYLPVSSMKPEDILDYSGGRRDLKKEDHFSKRKSCGEDRRISGQDAESSVLGSKDRFRYKEKSYRSH